MAETTHTFAGQRRELLWIFLFASAVSLLYFGPFVHNFFVADDYYFLERLLQGPQRLLLGYNDNLRVVSNALWWLLYLISDLDPFGYNLFNLILYVVNAVMVYLLFKRLFSESPLALFAAGLFVAGGVGADAVFWRGASATLLNVCFYLLALYTYLLFRQRHNKTYWYFSIGIFILAVFSKEEAASLPIIIVLLDLLLIREEHGGVRPIAKRVLPYVAIIVLYAGLNYVLIYQLLHSKSFMSGVAQFRPLYSLLASWTAFFLSPKGFLELNNPLIYITATAVPLSFLVVKDKKALLFAYLWLFITFLPQSLSSQSQFTTDMLASSISRHLYLPSIGSTLALAIVLESLRHRLPARMGVALCMLFFAAFIAFYYPKVHLRGERWQLEGHDMATFVRSMQRSLPSLPDKLYFTITNPPEGRSFMQAAVRTFYKKRDIFWQDSIEELQALPQGCYGLYIDYDYLTQGHKDTIEFFWPRI